MSAIGPKRKWVGASHRSASGSKADLTFSGGPLSRSLFGAKQTFVYAVRISATDPKRTLLQAYSAKPWVRFSVSVCMWSQAQALAVNMSMRGR